MKKIKICAFVCALAVGLTVTGCADTTWALKDGSITIPAGVYNYYLLSNASTVESLASSAAAASSGLSTSSTDMWSQTVSGSNASTWAMTSALKSCKNLAVVEKLCASRKVKLTTAENTSATSNASESYSSYTAMMSKNGISQTSLERISKDMYLESALFTSYYGTNGDKAVPATTIASYYTKNYAHVRQIFVAKIDTTTQKALTATKLAAAKVKANNAYALVKADVKNFNTYVTKYNEDTGETAAGYTFSEASATSSSYDTKFTALGLSLKVGEVGMAESDMGYFIEYKEPIDTSATTFTDSVKQSVLEALKGTEFEKILSDMVAKETFVQNDNTLNHFSPKKLDLTTSS